MLPIAAAIQILLTSGVVASQVEPKRDRCVVPGVTMSLETPTGPRFSGGEVVVAVRLTNTGATIAELEPRSDRWIWFEVTNEQGERIEPIQPSLRQSLVRSPLRLSPGYFWGRTFDLGKLFKFPKPGRYGIRAHYTASATVNSQTIATEPIDIEIRAKP